MNWLRQISLGDALDGLTPDTSETYLAYFVSLKIG